MQKPARHGIIIYSNDISRLALFYQTMFAMSVSKSTDQWVSLEHEGLNIIIHMPPAQLPPERMNTVKLFVSVSNHEEVHQRAEENGGKSLPGEWANPIFSVSNIADSEGNIIQLRVFTTPD